jgi:serine/threonine protein kinase
VKKDSGNSVCVQGKSEIWIIMEQAAFGDLRSVLDFSDGYRNLGKFELEMLMMCSIAMGMEDMHAAGHLHKDLKASNILLTFRRHIRPVAEGYVKTRSEVYREFKWAAMIGDYETSEDVIGTGFWRAPEVLQAVKDGVKPELTRKTDVYSFAMLCWELLTRQTPFADRKLSDYDHILEGNNRPELPPDLPEGLSRLINRCWQTSPQERPEFSEIVQILHEERSKISALVDIDALFSLFSYMGPSITPF